jgi:predicted nucleic acid-binding protein
MIIIADSSALVGLATCEALFLLDKLFDIVQVPKAVYEECTIKGKSVADILENYLKNKVVDVTIGNIDLPESLGKGETQAILLYKQQVADYLLIDDNRARKIAKLNDCKVIGSLGILLLAKQKNLIPLVTPYLEILENSFLFLNENLIEQVKKMAGE